MPPTGHTEKLVPPGERLGIKGGQILSEVAGGSGPAVMVVAPTWRVCTCELRATQVTGNLQSAHRCLPGRWWQPKASEAGPESIGSLGSLCEDPVLGFPNLLIREV